MPVVRGRVVDVGGAPVAQARVSFAAGPTHEDVAALTDAEGGFELTAKSAGEYTIAAVSDEAGSGQSTIAVPGGDHTIVIIRLT